MNLKERIEELGYHVQSYGYGVLEIYLHGDYILRLTRFERRDHWTCSFGYTVNMSNIERRLAEIRERRGL